MPEGQNIYRIVGWLVAVKGHIAGVSEGYHQLTQLGHFRERTANVGGLLQKQELLLDGPACPSGGLRGFRGQESPTALQACRCAFSNDYLWHAGTELSSSVPQVFNQVRTSSPLRWRPVSL